MPAFGLKKTGQGPTGLPPVLGQQPAATGRVARPRAKWYYWFAFTAVWCALQTTPYIGAPMMLVAAMGWSIITINAGFIAIIVDWRRRAVPAWMLAAPALWFGGYAVFAAIDQMRVADLQRQIEAHNAAISVPFDPARHSFVGDYAQSLARGYNIPVAYEEWGDDIRSMRIHSYDVCELVRSSRELKSSGIHVIGSKSPGSMANDECMLYRNEKPPLPSFSVTTVRRTDATAGAGLIDITLTSPDGASGTLISGAASPLPWIPMPAIGCGLGQAEWVCGADFMRMPTFFSADASVARAMGLRPRAKGEPPPGGANIAEVQAEMGAIAADKLSKELADLDRALADPAAVPKDTFWNFKMLRSDATPARDRADLMAAAFDVFADDDKNNAFALIDIITALPDAEAFRIAPSVVRTLDKDRPEYDREGRLMRAAYDFIARLSKRGAIAAPIAARAAVANGADYQPVLALCEMGQPAAAEAAADLLKQLAWSQKHYKSYWYQHQGIYLALLRMGWREQLLASPAAQPPDAGKRGWYEGAARNVTPASPASVCEV